MANLLSFSTASLPEADQFTWWREVFCRSLTRLTIERDPAGPFLASLEMRRLGELGLLRAEADPHLRLRTRRDIDDDPDECMAMYVVTSGRMIVECGSERIVAEAGQLFLLDSRRETTLNLTTPVRHMGIKVPLRRLAPLLGKRDLARTNLAPPPTGLRTLITTYATSLAQDPVEARHEHAVADHFCGLMALLLGANEEGEELGISGIGQARLAALKEWLDAHFTDPATSPTRAAAHLGISERYLHKLLEPTGRSFSHTLLQRRLQAARQCLSDAAYDAVPITTLAFGCGFSDLSYFNRCFKARYGMTPREVRRQRTRRPH